MRHITLLKFTFSLLTCLMISHSALYAQVNGQRAGEGGFEIIDPLPQNIEDVEAMTDMFAMPSQAELAARADARDYRREIRRIRHRYFDNVRRPEIRAEGLEQMCEFTDPASFLILYEELHEADDDVRLAMLDHFAGLDPESGSGEQDELGGWGQAALAWVVIHSDEPTMHYEALKRVKLPSDDAKAGPMLAVIEHGLRSDDDFVANRAGKLSGHLDLFDAIPLMIHGQSRPVQVNRPTGDDAWILVGRQRVYIQALIPIVGDNSGAFLPVPGVLTEGVILRVVEAVAVIYRTEIHTTLVAMTTEDFGRSTAHLGYDSAAWREWYNNEYVPFKQEQVRAAKLADERDGDG